MIRKNIFLLILSVFYTFADTVELDDQYAIQDVDQVIDKLEHNNINFVLFTFTDLVGNLNEIMLPIQQVKSALNSGLSFDSSSIPGYNNIESSDMVIKADLSTLRILPWTQGINKTAWITCNTYNNFEQPNESDPRYILQKAAEDLAALGYDLLVGPELEFFVLKEPKRAYEPLITEDNNKYFDPELNLFRQQENQIIITSLKALDIDVEKFHHEVASGQYEFSIKYSSAIKIADQLVAAKYTLNVLYNQFKKRVTFMPKPFVDKNGSGMHINYSLWDNKKNDNAFYSKNKDYNLSKVATHFIAGNINYIQELDLVFNQAVNSYKRLVPDFEAPVYICWAQKNRSSLFRLPVISNTNPQSLRMELRGPDLCANPYLAFAAIIRSGIEGIKSKAKLEAPITQNLFKLSKEELAGKNIKLLPRDLEQAINNFKFSNLAKKILTEPGHATLLKLKQKEWDSFKVCVTNWELDRYL